MSAWTLLLFAGVCEVCWAIGMKYSNGFTRLGPSIWTIVTMCLSVALLSQALRTLPVGTGYAIWTGIGAVGAAVFGAVLFSESLTTMRVVCIGLIVTGMIGLRIATPS
ncbi:MAG: quaternary ammonium compound efflux SMR transporter SugE [Phycisphaerales bacterium]|nr:quaternary ammonium compound efflux SMR transporter SugE [Phycisphaerales bacterium]